MLFLSLATNAKTQRINKKLIPVTILAALRLGVIFLSLATNARHKELAKAYSGYNLGGSAAWRTLSFSRNERETQRINKSLFRLQSWQLSGLAYSFFLSQRTRRHKELAKAYSGYNLGGSAAWRTLSFSRNERETQRINKSLFRLQSWQLSGLACSFFLSKRTQDAKN